MCDSESGIERWPNLRGKIAIHPELDLNKGFIRLNVRRILIPHSLLAATRPGKFEDTCLRCLETIARDNKLRRAGRCPAPSRVVVTALYRRSESLHIRRKTYLVDP